MKETNKKMVMVANVMFDRKTQFVLNVSIKLNFTMAEQVPKITEEILLNSIKNG